MSKSLIPIKLPARRGAPRPEDGEQDAGAALDRSMRGPLLAGLAIIGVFVVGFGAWASMAPIAGAAIAPGVVSPEGSRRTVQHLEGGIILDLRAADGDHVEAGDPLVVLEDTQARSNFQQLMDQRRVLAAMEARLLAEQRGAEEIRFPDWLLDDAERVPKAAEIVATQRNLFKTRQIAHESRKAVLWKRIDQLEEEIKGLRDQIKSQERELALIEQEVGAKRTLVAKGLLPRPELLALQRQAANIDGARARNISDIARAEQSIGETELQIVNEDNRRLDEVADKLANVRAELATVEEKLFASEDVLSRTVIKAPISGEVVNRRFNTTGGVVGPGEPILDIVPDSVELLIDARVKPIDIDVVEIGQPARIQLTAYAQTSQPIIEGEVVRISADALVDENSGDSYFKASIEVPESELAKLHDNVVLSPGMPAEVLIVTGERTLMGYLLEPLTQALRHSFRES